LAAVADQMVAEMGWHRDLKHRAGPREMVARVDHIMAVLTSTTEELTAAEIADRADIPANRRHDVYRHLRGLLASGLIVRSTTRPYTYRPSKLA
jgi:predicted ArsR family transcriptional regulator